MKTILILSIFVLVAVLQIIAQFSFPTNNRSKCCTQCTGANEKTYSIDHMFNHCGESCSRPSLFWLYKIFEPGLIRANGTDRAICKELGYTETYETVTHGIPYIFSIDVDLYS